MRKAMFTAAICLVLLATAATAQAHTLYMSVEDNQDGTVTISGMYSTGTVAGSTEVRVVDGQNNILLKGRTDADGEFTFKKPSVPYTIILDGGPGHTAHEEGP